MIQQGSEIKHLPPTICRLLTNGENHAKAYTGTKKLCFKFTARDKARDPRLRIDAAIV